MLIAIDIGNSAIKIGVYKNHPANFDIEVSSIEKDYDSFSKSLSLIIKSSRSKPEVIIGSVVPSLDEPVIQLFREKFRIKPMIVDVKLKTGVTFNYNPIDAIGADRIADSVAVNNLYQNNLTKIVVDFGTATVFEIISSKGEFLGGSIFPGLEVSSEALFKKTSLLEKINFEEIGSDEKIIGNSTNQSLKSSLFWGYISLTEGMIDKILNELNTPRSKAFVIGTGGFASLISNQTPVFDKIEPNLTLEGLRIIYELNK